MLNKLQRKFWFRLLVVLSSPVWIGALFGLTIIYWIVEFVGYCVEPVLRYLIEGEYKRVWFEDDDILL